MPNNYSSIKSANDSAVSSYDQLSKQILIDTEKIKELDAQIRTLKSNGQDSSVQESSRATLVNSVNSNTSSLQTTKTSLNNLRTDYENFIDHTQVVSNLTDSVPILLFPVRIETRFHKDISIPASPVYELWLRIFPDDVAIEAHESALTLSEIEQAKDYWTTIWPEVNSGIYSTKKINAWDILCRKFGSQRAAFIIGMLEPDDLNTGSPVFPLDLDLEKRYTSWTKAPETRVMPDVFVANLYATYNPANPVPTVTKQGKPIPYSLKVGIDPNDDGSLFENGNNLDASVDIKWLIDFDSAIDTGMGMKIPLTQSQYDTGFERVTVLGVKALVNDLQGKQIVEELVDNHHYNTGFSLLKQGTNTKNTQEGPSGYTDYEFGNVLSHNIEREAPKVTGNATPDEFYKNDGQRLAEALGLDQDVFDHIYSADSYDIRNAMNMNAVLFNSTIAYTMNVMMYPVFANVSVYDPTEETREYVTRYARSRGALPGIRIKKQPYGILPVTAYSKWAAEPLDPKKPYYEDLYDITSEMGNTWTSTAQNVKVAGDSNGEQAFVEAMGKHAVTKEYYSRYGVGPDYIWNNLVMNDMPAEASQWHSTMQQFAQDVQTATGFNFPVSPFLLKMNFKQEHGKIMSGLIDTQPLSDTNPVEPIGPSSVNYIQWIRTSNLFQLRDEDFGEIGAGGTAPPTSMFYVFLRQSFLLEYFNAACSLLELTEAQKREYEIINIYNVPTEGVNIPLENQYQSGPSRWAIFDQPYAQQGPVGAYMDSPAGLLNPAMANLVRMREILLDMEDLPTGELALLLTEHLDFCSFRLDSWKLGIMNQRLNYMRLNPDGTVKRQGIHIGAYAWVEDLHKNERNLVQNPGLPGEYNSEVSEGIEENMGNKGFIHAPSQNHAIAAAVLRAGYESNADDTNTKNHEINLTSERVRKALAIFEGIKNGQKLSALLGYEFERSLHEPEPGSSEELDKFIYPFRTKYKLEILTPEFEGAIDTVAAVNVLDGKKILDDYRASNDSIFIGLSLTPTNDEKAEIKLKLDRINGILDAVSDLAVSEGIFQLVNNNYEASGALSASLSGGANPPDAQIIKTPRNGITVTNRILMQLNPSGYAFAHGTTVYNSWSTLQKSQRAIAEPSLNQWLLERLPEPSTIEIYTSFENTAPGVLYKRVYLSDLDIQPIDLIYLIQDTLSDNESELAQRVKMFVRNNMGFGFDKEITIEYEEAALSNNKRFYDLHAYIVYLKKVIVDSHYLKGSEFCPGGSAEAVATEIYNYGELYERINGAIHGEIDPVPAPPPPPNTPLPLFLQPYLFYGLVQIKLIIEDEINHITGFAPPVSPSVPIEDRVASLSSALVMATGFGIERAVPKTSLDTSTEALNALVDAAISARDQIAKKLEDVFNVFTTQNLPAPSTNPTLESIAGYVPLLVKCANILFGDSFRILPRTKVQENIKTVLNSKFVTATNTLLDDHVNNPLIMEEWLCGASRVRTKVANLEMMSVLNDVVISNDLFDSITFQPFQFPYDNDSNDRWQAVKVEDKDHIKPGRLSLAISYDSTPDYSNDITGLVIDNWTEVIPEDTETTGLAFHFDQPEAKPPQALLLAVPPAFDGTWNWQDLLSVVNETLDEAKGRSVDYEALASTPYGHILPAVSLPVSEGAMTIGPDFLTIENMY